MTNDFHGRLDGCRCSICSLGRFNVREAFLRVQSEYEYEYEYEYRFTEYEYRFTEYEYRFTEYEYDV